MKPVKINDTERFELLARAAQTLKAVAHPARLAILHFLTAHHRLTVTDLQNRLGVSQSMTSQHLQQLRQAGVLSVEKESNQCYYSIKNIKVLKLMDCVENCVREQR